MRNATDFAGVDVSFLQEVTNATTLNEVFPPPCGWEYCISGQFAKDEAIGAGAVCFGMGLFDEAAGQARQNLAASIKNEPDKRQRISPRI
ncbi:hypothetical protein [Rhizobium sp.]|uniref:hypothetical protein n=1 Tax=Rhizobium sp. TaxID=391 RepID=UPI0028A85DFB